MMSVLSNYFGQEDRNNVCSSGMECYGREPGFRFVINGLAFDGNKPVYIYPEKFPIYVYIEEIDGGIIFNGISWTSWQGNLGFWRGDHIGCVEKSAFNKEGLNSFSVDLLDGRTGSLSIYTYDKLKVADSKNSKTIALIS